MASPLQALFIVGPTASGKTAAAVELAGRAPIEIINADSRQIYRGMSIGSAKPTPAEQAAAVHCLIDIADPDEPFSLGAFLALAREAIAGAASRGRIPVVVGGSGQYVWGLAEGWRPPPAPPDNALRQQLYALAQRDGAAALHDRLRDLDPASADAIDPRNIRRVARAIEVCSITGKPFSQQRLRADPGFVPVILGLRPSSRQDLQQRIDARVDAMLASGWLDETRALLDAGYSPDLPSFSAAGYRELAACLNGELTLDEAAARAKFAARRLARYQGAWFKERDPRIDWSADPARIVQRALSIIRP